MIEIRTNQQSLPPAERSCSIPTIVSATGTPTVTEHSVSGADGDNNSCNHSGSGSGDLRSSSISEVSLPVFSGSFKLTSSSSYIGDQMISSNKKRKSLINPRTSSSVRAKQVFDELEIAKLNLTRLKTLYGRDEEISQLQSCFESIVANASTCTSADASNNPNKGSKSSKSTSHKNTIEQPKKGIVFIHGESGCGK